MFWLLLFLCLEQTTKSTTNLFSKPVFHDGKTVNYHTGQLTPKLRMLSYPSKFRNNLCTQGQNTFHTQISTLATFHCRFVWLANSEFGLIMKGHVLNSSILNAFRIQYVVDSWCPTVSLCCAQLFCLFGNKIPFQLLLENLCKWCMHSGPQCPAGWIVQQVAIFGMLPK